ncbi:hypothetical protein V8F20_006356 [Naviculisporaceae sp. PSN 640]
MDSFMDELENLASAFSHQPELEADDATIAKWQRLFGYSASEAAKQLHEHRASILPAVSNEHWELVRAEKEAQGFDKEAYQHFCQAQSQSKTRTTPVPKSCRKAANYLLKMEGPLVDLDTIRTVGRIMSKMTEIPGSDDQGNQTKFCVVPLSAKAHIEGWLAQKGTPFQPTFVPYSRADKSLSTISRAPTLGVDTTLPQLRFDSNATEPQPTQSQYPVWYFFYGTLADPDVLKRLLGVVDPIYRPASVTGGRLVEWGGKYKALIDWPGSAVEGAAFLVESEEIEDALRCYETDKYEVVRCDIGMKDDKSLVKGLTFRFIV